MHQSEQAQCAEEAEMDIIDIDTKSDHSDIEFKVTITTTTMSEEETDVIRTVNSLRIVNFLLGVTNFEMVRRHFAADSGFEEMAYLIVLVVVSALSLTSMVTAYLQIFKRERLRLTDLLCNLMAFLASVAGVTAFTHSVITKMDKYTQYAFEERIIACIFGILHALLYGAIFLAQCLT